MGLDLLGGQHCLLLLIWSQMQKVVCSRPGSHSGNSSSSELFSFLLRSSGMMRGALLWVFGTLVEGRRGYHWDSCVPSLC
jgi:hypothetical protein